MIIRQKIKAFFSSDTMQRFCCLIALIFWMIILIVNLQLNNLESFLGPQNIWLIIAPIGLFVYQIAFNKRIVWRCTLGFIGIYSSLKVLRLITFISAGLNRDYINAMVNFKMALLITLIVAIIAAINWIVIKLKPLNKSS